MKSGAGGATAVHSLNIVQKDEEQEAVGGQVELLWTINSDAVESDEWQEGRVAVRAHYVNDVVQNYTVRKGGSLRLNCPISYGLWRLEQVDWKAGLQWTHLP